MPQNSTPELAVARTRLLIGCYRKADFPDPEIAMRAFVSVLARYPESVVIKVTEPATGIPSKLKWPPSIAEVVDACNEAMAPIIREYDRKMVEYRHHRMLPKPPEGPKMTVAEMEASLGRPLSGWVKRADDRPRFKSIDEAEAESARLVKEAQEARLADLESQTRRESAGGTEPPEAA